MSPSLASGLVSVAITVAIIPAKNFEANALEAEAFPTYFFPASSIMEVSIDPLSLLSPPPPLPTPPPPPYENP